MFSEPSPEKEGLGNLLLDFGQCVLCFWLPSLPQLESHELHCRLCRPAAAPDEESQLTSNHMRQQCGHSSASLP